PIQGTLTIEGLDVARHIVVIGGEIAPPPVYDPATMMLNTGTDYAAYTQVGFTGATGGTFQIQCMEKTYRSGVNPPVTQALPY
ncbi:hypothetical protein KC218_26400, partial [Mycobacterium tuberculosis]|nr:hypothetical protein [Mycobacterium tuberculosis]